MKCFLQIFFLIVFIVSNCSLVAQQTADIEWQKCYGGSNNDEAYWIEPTSDHGFIAIGQTYSDDGEVSGFHGYSDYWVIKLDSLGSLIWQKPLGGTKYDNGIFVTQISDGGFIVAGGSYSNDGDVTGHQHDYDYWVVRLDAQGNITWQKSLGGEDYDKAYAVQQTTDGGFIVAGRSNSHSGNVSGNHGEYDYWIVKLDEAGNLTWQKSLGGSLDDEAFAVQQTSDNGFIVAGFSNSNDQDVSGNHGYNDYWIVKLDEIGNLQWQKSLGGSGNDYAYAVQQTADGGFVVAGTTYSTDGEVTGNHGSNDYWIVKLDPVGNIIWETSRGGGSYDAAFSVQETGEGGFIVAGTTYSSSGDVSENNGLYDYWMVKLDDGGNLVWQKSLGGSGFDNAYSIREIAGSGFIVAGWTASSDGDVSGNHGNDDFWIVKLTTDIPAAVFSVPVADFFLFPNPVQNQLEINFTLSGSEIAIRVYNIQGSLVQLPVSFHDSKFVLNTTSLPNGFYTAEIIDDKTGNSQTGKFLVQH